MYMFACLYKTVYIGLYLHCHILIFACFLCLPWGITQGQRNYLDSLTWNCKIYWDHLGWTNVKKNTIIEETFVQLYLGRSYFKYITESLWESALHCTTFRLKAACMCVIFNSAPLHIQISFSVESEFDILNSDLAALPKGSQTKADPVHLKNLSCWLHYHYTWSPLSLGLSWDVRYEGETWQHHSIHALVGLDMTHGFLCKVIKDSQYNLSLRLGLFISMWSPLL